MGNRSLVSWCAKESWVPTRGACRCMLASHYLMTRGGNANTSRSSHHGFSYFVKSSVEHWEIWFTPHTESVLFTGYRRNVLLDDGGNTNMSGVSHHGFSYFVKSSVEHREIWFTLTHTERVIYTGYRRNVLLDDVGGGGNTNMLRSSHHGFSYFVNTSVEHREIWFTLTHTESVLFTGYRRNVLLDYVRGGGGVNTNMSRASHQSFSYFVNTSIEHSEIWFTLTHTERGLFTGYRRNVLLDDMG